MGAVEHNPDRPASLDPTLAPHLASGRPSSAKRLTCSSTSPHLFFDSVSLCRVQTLPAFTRCESMLPAPGMPASPWRLYRARLKSRLRSADVRVCLAFWLFGRRAMNHAVNTA